MPTLDLISGGTATLPMVAGLYIFRKLKLEMRILSLFFVLLVLVEAYCFYQAYNYGNTMWVFRFYTPAEYSFLVLVFSFWQKRAFLRRMLLYSIPLFVLIFLGSESFLATSNNFDNFTASLESVLLVAISAFTLLGINQEDKGNILGDPRFWVGTAVLIYFAGNLMIFGLSKEITFWWTHNSLNISANLLFSGGFLCLLRR